jgi:peptide/nickel transport system substrate-binding protein
MENDLNTNPTVVNGPFMLQEWVKDDHITLVRNPDYWRGAPYLEGLIYKVVPNETVMIQQLKTGEGDVGDIAPQYLVEIELQEHLNLFKYFDDGYTYIGFNMGVPDDPQPRLNEDGSLNEEHGIHPILGDKRVRQAVVYAIDRLAIISKVRFGMGVPMQANVLPAVGWAYNDELVERAYDLETAAALLEEAGWIDTDEDGVRECRGCMYAEEGTPLKLNLKTNAGNETRESIGVIAQDQLGEIGFDIEFEAMEWNAYLGVLLGQTFDMVIIGWTNMGSDPDDDVFWKAETDIPGAGFGFVSYYNPEVTELLEEAKTLPGCDQGERAVLYKQIQEVIYDEQPYNFVYATRDAWAYNQRIGGVNPGGWDQWHNVHEWFIEE